MANVVDYHRPESMAEALELLASSGIRKVVVGGGTAVNAGGGIEKIEVVDLQALRLGDVSVDGARLRIGATATLQDLADDERTPPLIADLARREAPSTLRSLGTIGGLVARGDGESELLAGLLAHGAIVAVESDRGTTDVDLESVLAAGPNGIVTAVTIETDGKSAAFRTGRTPGDRPIVAVVARRAADGEVIVALSGVAATPVLAGDGDELSPPADFRGSAAYRRHLASVLTARAVAEVAR